MKKRLGTIPKGLEWISEQQEIQTSIPVKKIEKQQSVQPDIPSAKQGLSEELIRATFILRQEYLDKIKAYAYWERMQIKEVFDLLCFEFFKDKKVRSIPKKRR